MNLNVVDLYTKDSGVISYTDGAETMGIITPDHEEGFCMLVKNTSDETITVTVKAGNSIYAMGDLNISVNGSEEVMVNLKNTGRYKNVHGENSGKIMIDINAASPSDVKVCAISL